MGIEQSEGYLKLLRAVEKDEASSPGFHDYRGKLQWVLDRVKHYAETTGVDPAALLNTWETNRSYWYMNYYQDANQPLLNAENVKVFDDMEQLKASIDGQGFRCPMCQGKSNSPYSCDSGLKVKSEKICDWKAGGLFGTMGDGAFVFVKDQLAGEEIFRPIAWETATAS